MNVKTIKDKYPKGTKILLHEMRGEDPVRMYDGLMGTVSSVDDIGQIHVDWDNGSTLALSIDDDEFEIIDRPSTIKVVYVEPGKKPVVKEIGTDLVSLQQAVNGPIEVYAPFSDPVCIVCNEEGKLTGLPLNRGIYDENGKLIEIIAGSFFICDDSGEDFASLPEEQLERYCKMFEAPETFAKFNGQLVVFRKVAGPDK